MKRVRDASVGSSQPRKAVWNLKSGLELKEIATGCKRQFRHVRRRDDRREHELDEENV